MGVHIFINLLCVFINVIVFCGILVYLVQFLHFKILYVAVQLDFNLRVIFILDE